MINVDMPEDAKDHKKYLLSWKSLTSVGKDANMLFIEIAMFWDIVIPGIQIKKYFSSYSMIKEMSI